MTLAQEKWTAESAIYEALLLDYEMTNAHYAAMRKALLIVRLHGELVAALEDLVTEVEPVVSRLNGYDDLLARARELNESEGK